MGMSTITNVGHSHVRTDIGVDITLPPHRRLGNQGDVPGDINSNAILTWKSPKTVLTWHATSLLRDRNVRISRCHIKKWWVYVVYHVTMAVMTFSFHVALPGKNFADVSWTWRPHCTLHYPRNHTEMGVLRRCLHVFLNVLIFFGCVLDVSMSTRHPFQRPLVFLNMIRDVLKNMGFL